ncbi:armadillo repeat-containing protein 7 [Panicum miliaceum]|uniref:Armadillo repeat-containing protein 7 n=1 Tax=Panicum miliaceum TaxID=4540 RepID=A0A3L6QNG5_PANMI|nr:armadillo repeat-containing protein 7 [Panicum miliaceum]
MAARVLPDSTGSGATGGTDDALNDGGGSAGSGMMLHVGGGDDGDDDKNNDAPDLQEIPVMVNCFSIAHQCGGIPLVIQCLSSSVRNTVTYAPGALYYLCNPATKKEILKPDVVRIIREYAAAGAVNTSFSNMANALLENHVDS